MKNDDKAMGGLTERERQIVPYCNRCDAELPENQTLNGKPWCHICRKSDKVVRLSRFDLGLKDEASSKSSWRKVLGQRDTPNKGFSRYKTENNKELPNRAEFTGDKFPSETGNPAKVEVDAFKDGNKMMQKDKNREDSSAESGSALMSEKAKRDDVAGHMKDEHVKPSYAGWRNILGDLSFKQKPDGTLQIDVSSHPNEPLAQNPVTQQPAPVSPEEADQSVEANLQKKADRVTITFDTDKTILHAEDFKSAIEEIVFELFDSQHLLEPDTTPNVKSVRVYIDTSEGPSGLTSSLKKRAYVEGDVVQHIRSGQRGTVIKSVGNELYVDLGNENSSIWSPSDVNLVTPSSGVFASGTKKWTIRKEGNLELIGQECEKFAEIHLFDNGTVRESYKVARDGHQWRELINQAVWEHKLDK